MCISTWTSLFSLAPQAPTSHEHECDLENWQCDGLPLGCPSSWKNRLSGWGLRAPSQLRRGLGVLPLPLRTLPPPCLAHTDLLNGAACPILPPPPALLLSGGGLSAFQFVGMIRGSSEMVRCEKWLLGERLASPRWPVARTHFRGDQTASADGSLETALMWAARELACGQLRRGRPGMSSLCFTSAGQGQAWLCASSHICISSPPSPPVECVSRQL